MVVQILKTVGKSLISALLTEQFIKEMIVFLLEKLAKRTSNSVDDAIVAKVKEALQSKK